MASALTTVDQNRLERLSNRLERGGPIDPEGDGAAVRALEGVMGVLGFTPLDAHTMAEFQKSMGLTPSGELDKKTLMALRDSLIRKREDPTAVRRGQHNETNAKVEQQLKLLGYDPGARDGISDAQLQKAISAFKRDQGFDQHSGFLGQHGQAALTREADGFKHAAWHGRRDLTANQRREDGVLAELSHRQNPNGTEGIGEGAHRPAIEQLQLRLRAAGYDPSRSDGVFDERTRGALEAFQRHSGVEVTGRLDAATWKKLRGTIIDTDQPASPPQRLLEHSGAVKRSEKLLAKAGFHPGKIDGLFTKQTAKAVRAFERKLHLHVDGQLGAKDLAALKKAANPQFPRPPDDYKHYAWRNVTANGRTIAMVHQAEAWAKKRGAGGPWAMYQGSYNRGGVSNSEGTHDGGGALDIKVIGKSDRQIRVMVQALRRAGFAAWFRHMDPLHIHVEAIGDRDLSPEARGQVLDYFHGLDGLHPSHPDPHHRPPLPDWAKKIRDRMT